MRRNHLLQKRNAAIRKRYRTLTDAHKEYRIDAIISLLSDEFFLSQSRIYAILSERKVI